MEITYKYSYDYIPSSIVDEEENYNDERKMRIEESIDNVLQPLEELMQQNNITYTKEGRKGEGSVTFTNLSAEMPVYKEIDEALGELGLEPTVTDQIKEEEDMHLQTPETHTMIQDNAAEDANTAEAVAV